MKRKDWIILGFIALIFLALRLPFLNLPLERDEGAYAYVGWIWVTGRGLPYADAYELKPPMLHLVYAIAVGLFGNNYLGIRIVGGLYMLAVVLVFMMWIRSLWGRKEMIAGGVIMALLMNSFMLGAVQLNAESLMLLPLIIAAWQITKSVADKKQRGLGIGLCLSLTALFKQVGVYPAAIFCLYYLWKMRSAKTAGWLLAGGLLPVLFFSGYFAYKGVLTDVYQNIVAIAAKATGDGFNPKILCDDTQLGVGCLAKWLVQIPWYTNVLFVSGLAGYLVTKKKDRIWSIGFLWTLGMWLVIKGAGWKDWNHYYLLPVPGLIIGLVLLWKRLEILIGNYAVVILIFLMMMCMGGELYFMPSDISTKVAIEYGEYNRNLFCDAPTVAVWIKNRLKNNESLLVGSDEAEIYFYAGLVNRYKWSYYGGLALPGMELYREEFSKLFMANPPKYVVLNRVDTWGEKAEIVKLMGKFKYTEVYKLNEYLILSKT